jgi:hypothetical protein
MAAAAASLPVDQYGAIRKIEHHDHIEHVVAANAALAALPVDSDFWIVHWMYQEFAECDGCGTHDHQQFVLIDNYGNSHPIQAEMPFAPWLASSSPFSKWLKTMKSFYRDTYRKRLDDPAIDVIKELPNTFDFTTFSMLSTHWLQAFATYTHTYAYADPTPFAEEELAERKKEERKEAARKKKEERRELEGQILALQAKLRTL